MRDIINLKASVGLAILLPSVEMVRWPRMHSRNWWRWTCGMSQSFRIGQSHKMMSVLSSAKRPLSLIMSNTNWKTSLTCDL